MKATSTRIACSAGAAPAGQAAARCVLDIGSVGGKDPSIYAAKAIESAIKIVCDEKKWTTGKEKGAHAFIDHLMAKSHGYLTVWEGEMLKDYFTKVRNPFGHGPGSAPMPALSLEQTDWAIETAMTWVRTIVRRL